VTIYRASQPAVDGVRFTGDNVTEVAKFLGATWDGAGGTSDAVLLETPEGEEEVLPGDYIIRSRDGGYRSFPGPIFEALYEALDLGADLEELLTDGPLQDNSDAMAWAKAFEVHFPYSGLPASALVPWFANYAAATERARH
jgi:hypothetical protein